jgi:hypothetical protein
MRVAGKLYFDNEELWRGHLDLAKYHEFKKAYDQVFGAGYPKVVTDSVKPPRTNDSLTDDAMKEMSELAKSILVKKETVAEANQELSIVRIISAFGFLWPFGFATALAFRLAKARADVIAARDKLKAPPTITDYV